MKPIYSVMRRNGEMRVFKSSYGALKFSRELPARALQYKKGVFVSHNGGETWQFYRYE